jgi:hypothetical protein
LIGLNHHDPLKGKPILSKLVRSGEAEDIASPRLTIDRCTVQAAVFEGEEQISAGAIDHIAGKGAVVGEVLIYGTSVGVVAAQLVREYLIQAESSVELETLTSLLLELHPTADVIQRPK